MNQMLMCIVLCLIGVVVAENDGNSVSHDLPSLTNYSRFGPLVVVPPPEMRGQLHEKVPPIIITKDSKPFPTLSPEQLKQHLEILQEFELHKQSVHQEVHKDKNENTAPEVPEMEDLVHEEQNEIPQKKNFN